MLQQSTISPGAARKPSVDFLHLREEALGVIRQLAGDTWTDHNLHDPGITILEQVCYALTDLGYRLNFSVPELLADAINAETQQVDWIQDAPSGHGSSLPGMPGLEVVLPAAPTTHLDWQGVLLDVEDVRSAGILTPPNPSPNTFFDPEQNEIRVRLDAPSDLRQVKIAGLHEIQVDVEEGRYRAVARRISSVFHANRPAGEDLQNITKLEAAPISLVAVLDLDRGVNPEEAVVEMMLRVDQYLSPQVRYKSRTELVANGMRMDEVMEGPLLTGGVLLQDDLKDIAPKKVLHLSRIIEQVFSVPGVQEVRALHLKGEHRQVNLGEGVHYWVPAITEGMVPRLDPDPSGITVHIDGVATRLDPQRVLSLFQEGRKARKARRSEASTLSLPRNRKVAAYQSIQHQFPDNYGINAKGLPSNASLLRQAQAHQLKTWLLFFEQVLSNYFSKAGNLGRMFQIALPDHGHFPDGNLDDVPEVAASFLALHRQSEQLQDAEALQALRRFERLLSHMLARFGQEVRYFPSANSALETERQRVQRHVEKMLAIYRDLPAITMRRGQGGDIYQSLTQPQTPGGLKLRLATLLGLRPHDPDLQLYPQLSDAANHVDFLMIEHIMLRPLPEEYRQENLLYRFRDGKIHKIVRLQSKLNPDLYRFRCFATGTDNLEAGDQVEIVFADGHKEERKLVLSWDNESFTIDVSKQLATAKGNPQGGSWNRVNRGSAKLYGDPWSLQLTFALPKHDPRFATPAQRNMVEQLLRDESPAHLALHVNWLDHMEMQFLMHDYYHWRREYSQYTHHLVEGEQHGKTYIRLRHFRNRIMRHIVAGETEPLRDLPLQIDPAPALHISHPSDDLLRVEVKPNGMVPIDILIQELEPTIVYTLVDPSTTVEESAIPYAQVASTQVPEADGLRITLPVSSYAVGTNDLAIWASDVTVGTGALLHMRIQVVVA